MRTSFTVIVLTALCAGVPSFLVGMFWGLLRNDVARGNRDVERVKEVIAAHPEKFGSLTINRGPADKFRLEGSVGTQQDLDLLREELIRSLAKQRVEFILAVEVREKGG